MVSDEAIKRFITASSEGDDQGMIVPTGRGSTPFYELSTQPVQINDMIGHGYRKKDDDDIATPMNKAGVQAKSLEQSGGAAHSPMSVKRGRRATGSGRRRSAQVGRGRRRRTQKGGAGRKSRGIRKRKAGRGKRKKTRKRKSRKSSVRSYPSAHLLKKASQSIFDE